MQSKISAAAGSPMSSAAGRPPRGSAHSGRTTPVRSDIQGLRAVAVAVVVIYHLWPDALPGGFVGVDVFFVVSGFLITAHLLGARPRRARDLAVFWSRRICRLLPAALLVLGVTLIASRMLAPETQWEGTARDVRAAALYLSNWSFAADSVDYLEAQQAPSPALHYWSLSVEEQFYLGWPLLLMLLFAFAALASKRRPSDAATGQVPISVPFGLLVVLLVSLTYSLHLTATDPARAYFVTPTRVWEFAAGGLLASLAATRVPGLGRVNVIGARRLCEAIALAGFTAIAWASLAYSEGTPFPGWHAVIPVLGAVAVIAARPAGMLGRALAWRPIQQVGNTSYSIYLWHWPLIVLAPFAIDRELAMVDKLALGLLTLILASATTRFVEAPFRRPRFRAPLQKPYAAATFSMTGIVALASLQALDAQQRAEGGSRLGAQVSSQPARCFGAAALADSGCPRTVRPPVVPKPIAASKDLSDAYDERPGGGDCFSYGPSFPDVRCIFGLNRPSAEVALVGNSHAGHLLPALQVLAERNDWRITTFMSSRCALASTPQPYATERESAACLDWVSRTTDAVKSARFDAVVMSNRIPMPSGGRTATVDGATPDYAVGYLRVLREWQRVGVSVLGIHDTPSAEKAGIFSVPDCLAENSDDFTACAGPRAERVSMDPLMSAIQRLRDERIRSLELTDYICGANTCDSAVGGVVVYFDSNHLTATYAATLAPYLNEPLRRLVAR